MSEKETESLSLLENKRTSMNTESKIKKFLKVAIEKGWKEAGWWDVVHQGWRARCMPAGKLIMATAIWRALCPVIL